MRIFRNPQRILNGFKDSELNAPHVRGIRKARWRVLFLPSWGNSRRSAFHALAALVVAINYFSFRVEIFDDEAEAHYRNLPHGLAITEPTLSWELFDKDNASQAFTIEVRTGIEILLALAPLPASPRQDIRQFQPVRDKSPPLA